MSVTLSGHAMYESRHKSIRNRLIAFSSVLLCAYASFAQSPETEENVLTADAEIATAGYFQLRWRAAEPIRLVESMQADFSAPLLVYEGSDSGHTVSGRADGELFYRLESAATGEVLGRPLRVVVAHHPIGRAIAFFAIGAVVFVATLALILIGSRADHIRTAETTAGSHR